LYGEFFFDQHEIFDKEFIDDIFNATMSDETVYAKDVLDKYERDEITKALNNVKSKSVINQLRITKCRKLLQENVRVENRVSAMPIISQIRNMVSYELTTMVILAHPEKNMGMSLDSTTDPSCNHSMLYEILKNEIKAYDGPNDMDANYILNKDFSFKHLHNLGISFGYEIPIFANAHNLTRSKRIWADIMKRLVVNMIDSFRDINLIMVGCSDEFTSFIKEHTHGKLKDIHTLGSIYEYGDGLRGFGINTIVAAELGNIIANQLVFLDKTEPLSNLRMKKCKTYGNDQS
jgi:hypothetical protein